MKIVTVGWIKALVFLAFAGCASKSTQNATLERDFFSDNSLKPRISNFFAGGFVEHNDDTLVISDGNNRILKIVKSEFTDIVQAKQHLMNRRVSLSAAFRDFVEPYYGLVEKRKCVDPALFNTDFKELDKNTTYFSVQLPVDSFLNLFDCNKGVPPLFAQYTFILCANTLRVFEVRDYRKNSDSFAPPPLFSCIW